VKTVFVGLSGGVDSAVSALLLKEAGYRVVGAHIQGWEPDFLPCTGAEDRLSAMRVAAHLQIPFVTYDFEEEYKREVVDYFVSEYASGRTPNPDVMCNRTIKFGAFWERAKAEGADYIATGHYAQTDGVRFLVSRDTEKDQTYFLWTLTQEDLRHSLFPVGALEKKEVRRLAALARLPNALRKDSQGLCFLGHVDMKEFLKRYIPQKPGEVLDTQGTILGEHEGAWYYTIGQHIDLSGASQRQYVISKDIEKNTLTVSAHPGGTEKKRECAIAQTNWISGKPSEGAILARYRYRGEMLGAAVAESTATFSAPILVAAGQSIVFYSADGKECLGGAIAA
jgi:tRNA-specific 2-thiouridylase